MNRKARAAWWGAGAAAVLLIAAAAVVLLTGSGSSSSRPFSYSVNEIRRQCGGGSFVPMPTANTLLEHPPPKDWRVVQNDPEAIYANTEIVEIHLGSGSEDEVTLKGIHFHVHREKRRQTGLILYPGCTATESGWLIAADFDAAPPGVSVMNFPQETRRVHFPWTISLKKPLTVYLIARTFGCNCAWRADVPWTSGGKHGTILLANGKKDFRVTYSSGLEERTAQGKRWIGALPVE